MMLCRNSKSCQLVVAIVIVHSGWFGRWLLGLIVHNPATMSDVPDVIGHLVDGTAHMNLDSGIALHFGNMFVTVADSSDQVRS